MLRFLIVLSPQRKGMHDSRVTQFFQPYGENVEGGARIWRFSLSLPDTPEQALWHEWYLQHKTTQISFQDALFEFNMI